MVRCESVDEMDLELARLARLGGALRFGLGVGLEALARSGGHHELGFASLEAYALERCERSARWVQESRWLARRVEALPTLRRALVAGEISFSMAQAVAKAACADDETAWLAEARKRTVREMRSLVRRRTESTSAARETDEIVEDGGDEMLGTLTVTVDREDAWLFECARMIAQQVGATTMRETVEALLGEGTNSLLASVCHDDFEPFDGSVSDFAQRQWEEQLSRWREEAEVLCEARFRAVGAIANGARAEDGGSGSESEREGDSDFTFVGDAAAMDAELRRIATQLAARDFALGSLAEAFWKADGWRRLGYATAAQYSRERLGMSWSSIKAKRELARRAEKMPQLSTAIEKGELGYEAARLVASVATLDTVEAWLERAVERTVRFLREEVETVRMFERLTPSATVSPPSEAIMQEVADLESRVVSGAVFREVEQGQMSAGSGERFEAFGGIRRRSRAARHSGRVTLRFLLGVETQRYYRWLERLFERHAPARMSFLRFLCCSLIEAWKHALGSAGAYANVYGRDRYRCTSPVCGRRDVTPHHLKFRSAGGDDSAENVASLCVWCHLEGIHGGSLRATLRNTRRGATPPASDIAWTIGRTGHTTVRGRRREAAPLGV